MVGAGGEQLRSVRTDPLHNLVQLGAHGSACVRACCLLMSQLLCLVSSLAPCLVRRDRERPDAVVRVRARSPLEGSRPSRWWGRDSGLGTMQVPRVARGGSRLCFCRVVLRDAVERKLRGTHRPCYIVLFPHPRHPSGHRPSHLGGHSEGRRDGLPKALDVGEVSIVTGSRRRSFHPVTG